MDLAAFLAARLDEDDAEARAQMAGVCARCGSWGVPHACTGIHVVNSNALHPARVLREVAAKRAILELHEDSHECSTYDHNGDIDNCTWVETGPCSTLRSLAAVYSDHPDYDPAWGA